MNDNKDARRYRFILEGDVSILPIHSEDGEIAFIMIEAYEKAWQCHSQLEVNDAIDAAIYLANIHAPASLH